jgi:Predicted thioesterase
MKNHGEIEVRVRYSETDQMGVVYHSNYLNYLELSRVEWLRELGFSYAELEKKRRVVASGQSGARLSLTCPL